MSTARFYLALALCLPACSGVLAAVETVADYHRRACEILAEQEGAQGAVLDRFVETCTARLGAAGEAEAMGLRREAAR